MKFYGPKSDPTSFEKEKPSTQELMGIYDFTFEQIENGLDTITDSDLNSATAVPNPAVKLKSQALLWLPQHQSWHNGQIALLKRVLASF